MGTGDGLSRLTGVAAVVVVAVAAASSSFIRVLIRLYIKRNPQHCITINPTNGARTGSKSIPFKPRDS